MNGQEEKAAIRREMRLRRKAVGERARQSAAQAICAALLARQDVQRAIRSAAPIAVYLASPAEIDLSPFVKAVLTQGGRLVAPRWNGGSYDLAALTGLTDASLCRGPMNILEPRPEVPRCAPNEVGLWLVPGLAFTFDGARLGYGGGWYDRLLADVADETPRLGIAYDFQVVAELPTDAHDIRLTDIVHVGEGAS